MRCRLCSRVVPPVSRVLRPMRPLRPKRGWTLGRRRSASMSRTRVSPWARTQARLLETVVLPSDGVALVRRMSCGGLPVVESSSEVRREREGLGELRFGCGEDDDVALGGVRRSPGLGWRDGVRGTMASEGSWVMASISPTLRRPVSRFSSRKARMMPISRLTASMVRMMVLLGWRVGAAAATA